MPDAHAIHIRVGRSFTLDGALVGRGRTGVVLANQSDRDLCSWIPLTRVLVHADFQVLLFDYSGADPQTDVAAAARKLRQSGARSVALIGASKGARAVLVAASLSASRVSAVVSLSAESTGRTGPPRITPFVRRLHVPVLFLAARHDPWTADGVDTHELYEAAHGTQRQLVELPGAAHGVDLLAGRRGRQITKQILSFLRQHIR
jgi:dienelactone hydrolase